MKQLSLFILICLFGLSTIKGQNVCTKTIIDFETQVPISGVHVYNLDHYRTGTITNENGVFILHNLKGNDSLCLSHISYQQYKQKISNVLSDTIWLKKRVSELDEFVVHALSGKEILNRVIDSLFSNHSVEPIIYEVYVRSTKFEKNRTELHVVSEYLMNVYQNKNANSEFQIIKTRAKPFSKAGKKYFKDMRMMDAISINSNNIFKYKKDIFKKQKLKKFDIKIVEEISNGEHNLVKLLCLPKKNEEFDNIVLYVDSESYGIQKMITYYSKSGDEFSEIGFKQINNKWYLQYSKRKIYTTFFDKWKSNSKSIYSREVIYNINSTDIYDNKVFKIAFNLIAEPIKPHLGDWSDIFWEDFNYIPLPDWIKSLLY